MAIEKFRGEYFFLSNMYELDVPIPSKVGILVPTSEHAYQSAKFVNPDTQLQIASLATGIETKEVAHRLTDAGEPVHPNWQTIKIGVMLGVVRDKFNMNPDIAELLVTTGDQELVEGNTWGDRYWGVDPIGSDNGLNNLGLILMQVRSELVRRHTLAPSEDA